MGRKQNCRTLHVFTVAFNAYYRLGQFKKGSLAGLEPLLRARNSEKATVKMRRKKTQ